MTIATLAPVTGLRFRMVRSSTAEPPWRSKVDYWIHVGNSR